MTEPPPDRVQELFDRAVGLPPDRRAAFLEDACAGDPTLRAEVEDLLAFDADFPASSGDEGLLRSPLVRVAPEDLGRAGHPAGTLDTDRLLPPSAFPNYRILRRIAEGGMGAVYEAEQDRPRRAVALKVIRPGLASPALVRRFVHEAQILGRLHHPGIAQVYEAGLADDGQPFFAMEFIRGLPLDEYARRRGLGLRDRLGLLARVCDAVQHAHDRGVIHRDLKPANILVDQAGQPKVLDFGVARATDADLLTAAGLTQTGQLLGTPSYMSPEQVIADPDAIDHRADVYALGVILFELSADRLPHRLERRSLLEATRMILEDEPPLLGSIHAELRGDVETIAARALEKEPARRYPSAAALADDLRRWLAHEPILARQPSTLYQLGRFARRNRALVGGVAATGLALVLGLIGTAFFAVGEARQRGQAEHNARLADDERREARFQTYRARLSAAVTALQNHDALDAARHLDAAPEELRGWEWRHLRGRIDDSSAVVPLPVEGAGYLLAGQDRLRVAFMTPEGLRLSDPEGGDAEMLPIRVEGRRPDAVTATSRGLRAVVWADGRTFELRDEAGRTLRRFDIPEVDSPRAVAVSPDGTRLATWWQRAGTTRIAVLDATTGAPTAVCEAAAAGIRHLAFSSDGTRLASAGDDRTASVWDAATGARLATCRGHADKVLGVAFRPDGSRLATVSGDGTVRQWDPATGLEAEPPYERHSGEVLVARYSPDGEWVASAGTDRAIRVWRATGRKDAALLLGHTGGVIDLAFDPSGRRLASLSANSWLRRAGDDTVRVWDIDPRDTLPALRGHDGPIYPVAYRPDGRRIASGDGNGSVRFWDAATGAPCATLPHPGGVWSLTYTPDGRRLVTTSSADSLLRVWDAAENRIQREIPIPGDSLWYVVAAPDGATVAATAFDPESRSYFFHICDVLTGERRSRGDGWALAYSPDGRRLAVQDRHDDRTMLLVDARTHATVAALRGHEANVFKAAFSPDGRSLATCSEDRTIRLWDISGDAAGGACRVLRGHTDEVFALAFHPDGSRLASGGEDRTVWIWDLARGEELARLQGHASFVWSVAFSPDGSTLASASGDATVRLWGTAPPRSEAR